MSRANRNQRAARRQTAGKRPAQSQTKGAKPRTSQTPRVGESAATVETHAEAMAVARRIAWWALLAMVFLVPIATSNWSFLGFRSSFTFDSFDIVKVSLERMLGLVAIAAWAWDVLRRGGRIRFTPVDWLILAFLAWVGITTGTSIHWPTALFGTPRRYEGLLTFINYAFIYFLILQFADTATRIRRLAQTLFWASVIVAAYGLLQFAGLDFIHWTGRTFEANRAFSTYGNPDLLGGFLIFSVTVALGLALFEKRPVWRLAYWVGFGLNGVALIAAFTRGAWIGGVVSLALLGVIAWRQRATMRRIDWLPAGASIAVAIGLIWRSFSNSNEVMNFGKRISSIFQFSAGSGQTRTEIWRAALAAIKQRPIQGWGADTFRFVFPKFKPVEYVRDAGGSSKVDNAHDYPLQLATGTGIPGVLMFYGIFVWAGVRSFRTVFRRSGDPTHIILGAFWAASAGYLVQLLFGISVTGVTFLLWIALGVLLVPTARSLKVRAAKWGTLAAALVIVVAASGIGYQAVLLAADNAYLHTQTETSLTSRTAEAVQAARLNPSNVEYRGTVGIAYADEMVAYLQAGVEAQQKGQDSTRYVAGVRQSFASAESRLKDTITFAPYEYDAYVALAYLYNVGGQALDKNLYRSAINVANQGLKISPYGTTLRVQLARALQATGQTAEAVSTLEYCVRIDPKGGEAAIALASLYRQEGRVPEAISVLKSVEARAPGQPGVADAIKQLESAATQSP